MIMIIMAYFSTYTYLLGTVIIVYTINGSSKWLNGFGDWYNGTHT